MFEQADSNFKVVIFGWYFQLKAGQLYWLKKMHQLYYMGHFIVVFICSISKAD